MRRVFIGVRAYPKAFIDFDHIERVEQFSFRGEPVSYRYELVLYATGPVLCRVLDILDDPRRPFGFGQKPNPRELERERPKRRTEALYPPPPTAGQPRAPGCHRLAVEHLSLTGFWT